MKRLILLCSTAAFMPAAAFAQSTGSQEFEAEAIVVTGTRATDVGGVQTPDTSKPKSVLTQEFIARQNPGQTILDTINATPGVSFQNNDAYGSSGGTLTIRGFSSDRVSLTFDGVPLNDSGNYAIFSNQQLDPELIEQVNVNLGTTDVDSPTASATGGTVNYRTRLPGTKAGGRIVGSLGQFDFRRIFALVDTGEIGPWGTRAFVSISNAKNENPFNNYGKVDKQQYNARIYQPLGANGDFVSLSGHYNRNRNNFFGSVRLRNDLPPPDGFPSDSDEREYDINYPCLVDTPQPGAADFPAPAGTIACGTEFDRRFNPSNTGNIRGASRFTLTDKLILTVDPSFQYVKANGGGTVTAREAGFDINPDGGRANCATTPGSATVVCVPGFFSGNPFFGGVDLNADGDILDQVTVLAPSQTRTYRFGVIAGLRYDINDDHSVRAGYTFDHANHRQTGQVGLLDQTGEPFDVFPVDDPLHDATGTVLQKRDRQSFAILHQVSAEYRGEFMEDRLTVNIGARLPFFTRDLDNNCFTSSASGFVECSGGDPEVDELIDLYNPTWADPQTRKLKYNDLLPNVGVVFDVTPRISVFANYAKGLSVPSTDNLYNAFFFDVGEDAARPDPETTDSFDGGLRYRSSKIQAQVGIWKTKFHNRSASAFDPELLANVFRNLGTVDKWGIDGSIAWEPVRRLTLYAFGSWMDSEIKDDIQVGALPAGVTCDELEPTPINLRSCAFTAGKRESGAPKYTFGFSGVGSIGPVDLGVTAKRTGPRFIFDTNQAVFTGDFDCPGVPATGCPVGSVPVTEIFPSKAPAYWLVNLDARLNMDTFGIKNTYFQLNVYNLFDETYVGGFGGGLNQSVSSSNAFASPPFVQIGAPRTVSGTLSISF